MINNYQIFFFNDINNNVTIKCTEDEFINELIKEELIENEYEFENVNWIIFENGKKIKG
jgi:hypothetical protein